jgi:hypothetical protein
MGPKAADRGGRLGVLDGHERSSMPTTGAVSRIPCTVRDYVFDDFNFAQGAKVSAASDTEDTSEVWWYLPVSLTALRIDRYVVYNYGEQVWYYGALDRTAWMDRGIFTFPIAAGPGGDAVRARNWLGRRLDVAGFARSSAYRAVQP